MVLCRNCVVDICLVYLQVELKIRCDDEKSVTVTCSWCVTLALVTAAVTLEVAGEVAGELVTPGTLLHHLTHGDTGSAV